MCGRAGQGGYGVLMVRTEEQEVRRGLQESRWIQLLSGWEEKTCENNWEFLAQTPDWAVMPTCMRRRNGLCLKCGGLEMFAKVGG